MVAIAPVENHGGNRTKGIPVAIAPKAVQEVAIAPTASIGGNRTNKDSWCGNHKNRGGYPPPCPLRPLCQVEVSLAIDCGVNHTAARETRDIGLAAQVRPLASSPRPGEHRPSPAHRRWRRRCQRVSAARGSLAARALNLARPA